MANFIIECSEPWFTHIKTGAKPVEGRKGTPKWASIKIGDTITFIDGKEGKFNATVTGVNKYEGKDALVKYLETETIARVLPGVKTSDEGIKIYSQWSTQEQISKYGFLGIQVAVI